MRYYSQWMVSIGTILLLTVITCRPLLALVPPSDRSGVGQLAFRHPDFEITHAFQPASQLPAQAASAAQQHLTALGLSDQQGRLDRRGGRWASLLFSHPLLPGSGVGNNLQWSNGAPQSETAHRQAAWNAFYGFLRSRAAQLRIDLNELPQPGRVSIHANGDLVQIHTPRFFNGVRVRDNYLTATLSHGNLILFGANNWGTINISTQPEMSLEDAQASLQAYLDSLPPTRYWGAAELNIVSMARGRNPFQVAVGQGYAYRLVWVLKPSFADDYGHWEALVDADSGEVISFVDTNHYAEARGGVYPVTNDGITPDGVEQPGWPMPFNDVSTGSGTVTTDTGGNLPATGSMTSELKGPFIRMNDLCGAISLTGIDGINFGTSGGTDCTTPGFGGTGNTHASRTGFYELNKIKEMARGQLPANSWLQQQLTANMNITSTCNAFWNGSTVNFYRSGGGCFNTGEIAGVFDHEWGHGMDNNDANPSIAGPSGEGIADIYTALRLNDSCIGRNFRSTVCTGFGDPCLTCTGVRDIDYLKRASGNPHDYSWSNANCGGSVHCVGAVYAEAVWSLWKRYLTAPPYSMGNNTAHEVVTRLTFLGAGNTGTWFSGAPPYGGCAATSGYMNFLAADDDDGNLSNGTPHMQAIYGAFNDQEIACDTPAVQDAGCDNTPTVAPTVSTGNGNQLVTLSWNAVPNATRYSVYRTEGVFACDFGKVKLGETTATTWNDSGLQNGRDYAYVVIPIGDSDSCFGPASSCVTDAPVGMPDFFVSCAPASANVEQGAAQDLTCTVLSSFDYTGTVSLSCSGNPPGIGCSFSPPTVSPPVNGSAASTLTLSVGLAQDVALYNFDVSGDDGDSTRTSSLSIQVTPAGQNGPQTAVYDTALGAPGCAIAGTSCDSSDLLDGRAGIGPETNQPNTLDACADGTSGSYHSDESNDSIVVRTLDLHDFREGATVEIAATVWAWSGGSSDTADFYYAANANNPVWTYIGSVVPPGGGTQVLTQQYTLPAGGLQAVRVNFRWQGSASPCTGGSYDDRDDLVFAVGGGDPECTVDADCDDGLYCNGAETCSAGLCQAGNPVVCDDGLFCNGTDTCNEDTDSCDDGTPPVCNDGLYCNGTETCDETTKSCLAGTPVVCDDGLFCNGTETCNEGTDSCDEGPEPNCDDGVGCTLDSCNEASDSCDHVANDGLCPDDGAFCNGTEFCDASSGCQSTGDPCSGNETCDEIGDECASTCEPKGASCQLDGQCCSGKCRGKPGFKSCK